MKPRVKIHDKQRPGGSPVTVSGIPARELKAILTSASLHLYDSLKKAEEGPADLSQYCNEQLAWIQALEKALEAECYRPAPPSNSIEARKKRVREQRSDRLFIDEIVAWGVEETKRLKQ